MPRAEVDPERAAADASVLPPFVSQASTAPVTAVRDVLILPTTVVRDAARDHPPAGDTPVPLTDGLELTRLPAQEVELVMNACSRRGHFFVPVRQFGQRYSLVRHHDPAVGKDRPYGWDDDHLIFYAMVLSRLVHDNGHSLEYAARVVDHSDGRQQVIPAVHGTVATYRLRSDRDWLTQSEVEDLCGLLAAFVPIKDEVPWPVVHALNVSEDAVHLQTIQRSILLLGAGLEGLIHTSNERVAQQFRERLPRLAAEVGVDGVTENLCRELYSARSEAAHGAQVTMFRVRQRPVTDGRPTAPEAEPFDDESEMNGADKWAKAQDLLRAAVRRAIEDPEFREVFADPQHVRTRWPVEHDGRQL